MLEQTLVAVEIRLAEAAAEAVSRGKGLVLAPDAGSRSLLGIVGAASRIHAQQQESNA